jgi:hypothetical protein
MSPTRYQTAPPRDDGQSLYHTRYFPPKSCNHKAPNDAALNLPIRLNAPTFHSRSKPIVQNGCNDRARVLPWWPDPVELIHMTWTLDRSLGNDYGAWGLATGVATDEAIIREGTGIGDEVFTVGRFRNHLGTDRNEPIARVRNIAAIPSDLVYSHKFGRTRAILFGAQSIGGLSRSPEFVNLGLTPRREGKLEQSVPNLLPLRLSVAFRNLVLCGLRSSVWVLSPLHILP